MNQRKNSINFVEIKIEFLTLFGYRNLGVLGTEINKYNHKVNFTYDF